MKRRTEYERRVAELVAAGVPVEDARESVSRELQYEGDLLPIRTERPKAKPRPIRQT